MTDEKKKIAENICNALPGLSESKKKELVAFMEGVAFMTQEQKEETKQ